MKSNEIAYPKRAFWTGLVMLPVAGLWLWQTQGGYMALGLVVGLLALSAVFGGVWLYRSRAAHRHFAALDAYAEKELARAVRRPHPAPVTRNRALSESNV
jgi:hypothetical protein